jgi:hypothetical protein
MNTNIYTNRDIDINNGLITKIWGPALWIGEHSISFGYPLNPTDEEKLAYKKHFESLADVLPCIYCRNSYKEFISSGDTQLNDAVLENRTTLTKWLYRIHNLVNEKLGVDYGVTYDDVVNKYESFRARCIHHTDHNHKDENSKAIGCIVPLDYKAFSYRQVNAKDCPILPPDLIEPFVLASKLRKIKEKDFEFYNLVVNKYSNDLIKVKNDKTIWTERNKQCQRIIQYMRESGISAIEFNDIEWKNTPTRCELKLLLMFSTTMSINEVKRAINELYCNQTYVNALVRKNCT